MEALQAGVQKFYVRVMKGNMGREVFAAWVERTAWIEHAAHWGFTIELFKGSEIG